MDTISRFKVIDNRFREHITLEKFEIRERYISGTEIEIVNRNEMVRKL